MSKAQTVIIESAEELGGTPEVRILRGQVRLRQDTVRLYCEEAQITDKGDFTAKGRVITWIGNSGEIRAERLTYTPETRRLTYEGQVEADFPPARLKAPRLHYDRTNDVAWYEGGGTFSDTTGEIQSDRATYDTRAEIATFSGQVRLYRGSTQAQTDSLIYESRRHYAIFPAGVLVWDIKRQDTLIAKVAEWNRHSGEIFLRQNAHYRDTVRLIWAAEAYYDRLRDSAYARCDIRFKNRNHRAFAWADTAYWTRDSLYLQGNVALLYIDGPDTTFIQSEVGWTARSRACGIGQAELMRPPYWARSETLCYDTILRIARLHKEAWLADSVMQLQADRISIYLKDNRPDSAHAAGAVRLLNQADSLLGFYHQVSSDSAAAFWDTAGTLRDIHFFGRVQLIYYQAEEKRWTGAHHAQSNYLYVLLDTLQQPAYVRLERQPKGTFYPMSSLIDAPLWLKGAVWVPPERQPSWPFRRPNPFKTGFDLNKP